MATLALALAACGSRLDPEAVRAANGSTQVTAVDSSGNPVTTGPVTDGGTDPAAPVDPGTPADPGAPTDPGAPADPGETTGTDTGGDDGGPTAPPVDPDEAGSCDGFKNGPGITDDTITIGNSSDISGPVPGLFETAQDGIKAFVAYFNASVPDGICGRKLSLKTYDSATDASADQRNYAAACNEVFAMIGSQSAFDLGGAKTAQDCGLPDIRAGAVTFERNACTTCFSTVANNTNTFENAVPDFIKRKYGSDAAANVAYLYTNAGAAAQNALAQKAAMEKRGLKFTYVQGIDVSEFNYAPYVQAMKDRGVQTVFFTTSYQYSVKMRQAMQQQNFTPKLYIRDPTDYNPDFVATGGSAVEGTVVYMNFVPFEEANKNAETGLYTSWLQQAKPGADPLFFGVFAWSAGRLFVDLANKLGGKLSRETLIAELRKVKDWTANDLHSPQPVGSKQTGECWRFVQLQGGKWVPIDGTKYSCTGVSSVR
ncbi:ABC transporter substrate-binding protein [Nocardioides sp.]|uniref:ABC transporter substrate-binding protein n=1 Tax=Nocardioides sp. TaxID=35761 RepID=UPI0035135FB3